MGRAGMRTLAELLDHYDRNQRVGMALPQEFAAWYRRLGVLDWAGGSTVVSVRKYRMNTRDPSDLDEAGRIRDAIADAETSAAIRSLNEWVRTWSGTRMTSEHQAAVGRLRALHLIPAGGHPPRRLRRVFMGKGTPRDIALALSLLQASGRLSVVFPGLAAPVAMQNYCDRFIGVDCSGFANNYFTALGRRPDDLTDRPTISMYARPGRRLSTLPGSPRNHVFCWINGESRTGVRPGAPIRFSHIVVLDDWVRPPDPVGNDPTGAVFRCSQSSASLGGITTLDYEVLRAPTAGARAKTWRIRRLPGSGDNVLEPASAVWNDVFLAPPL